MSEENNLHEKESENPESKPFQVNWNFLPELESQKKINGYLLRFISEKANYCGDGLEFYPKSPGIALVPLKDKKSYTKDFPDRFIYIKDDNIYNDMLSKVKEEIFNHFTKDIDTDFEKEPEIAVTLNKSETGLPFYTIQIKTNEAVKDVDQEPEKAGQTDRPVKKQDRVYNLMKEAMQDTTKRPDEWKELFDKEFGKNKYYTEINRLKDTFKDIEFINGMSFYGRRKGRKKKS
ncbi:MAG: hypothetical protein KAX28_10690 [Candidatus Marinimicrobia bacterium]|nr:hypothetical protein [Candidatus Neomarinimicrobiota bacterium]